MIDLRQTSDYAKFMENLGWEVEKVGQSFAYIKRLSILGSFVKIQRPDVLREEEIDQIGRLCKKNRTFQLILEPRSNSEISLLTSHNFRLSKSYFVPSKTIQIDLTKSETQLLKEMHQKTRYNIKRVKSYKLKVTSSQDILSFANFWQKCALKQRGMFLDQKREIIEIYKAFSLESSAYKAFCKNAHIVSVEKDNVLLAGILLICTQDIAYYMYAASSQEGKKLFAPTIAAWEAIKLSKKLKKKLFDFEGIYDSRFPIRSWLGFTRFKQSFGGTEIEYPGTYTKFLLPFLRWK